MRLNRTVTLVAIATIVGVIGGSLVGARPMSAQDDGVSVTVRDLAYSPATIQVKVGDTVIWTNSEDIMPHDVTSGAVGRSDMGAQFASEIMMPGQTFAATFSEAGEFVYFCKLHPTMMGVVIVAPS